MSEVDVDRQTQVVWWAQSVQHTWEAKGPRATLAYVRKTLPHASTEDAAAIASGDITHEQLGKLFGFTWQEQP